MRRAVAMAVLIALSGPFLAGCGVSDTDKLTATTWYLVSGGEGNPAWQWTVPADLQSRYTIRLEKDNTFTSQADCNQLAGSWQASGSDRVTITPGPTTRAFCGGMSFDILYAGTLSQVRSWNVASTGMTLSLADGGRLAYTSVATHSPSASAEPTPAPTVTPTPTAASTATATAGPTATATATATVTATATATATATVTAKPTPTPTATATVTATATATVTAKPTPTPTAAPGPGLTSRAWQLTAFTLKVPAFEGSVPRDQQARYTIEFHADGTFTAQADCYTVNGTHSPANPSESVGNLKLVPGPATLKACEEGSYGDLYITGLASTTGFAIQGDNLTLTLADSGALKYR